MTGEVVGLGGRKPPPPIAVAFDAARSALPEHDALQPVLDVQQQLHDAIQGAARRFDAAQVLTPEAERQLVDRVAKSASSAAREAISAAHRRLDRTVTIASAAAIAALVLAGVAAGWWWGVQSADAAMAAARADVPAVFGALSLADASDWARLIRNNPPIKTLLAAAKPMDGQAAAVWLPTWVKTPAPAR